MLIIRHSTCKAHDRISSTTGTWYCTMHPPLDTGRPVQVQVSGPSASFGKEKEQRLIANILQNLSAYVRSFL
jgi:hypothetical protein